MISETVKKALISIQQQIRKQKVECAGAIFENGTYSFNQGAISNVKVDSRGIITWHSHTDEKLQLSLTDWLCFFCSEVNMTALITAGGILVLQKRNIHQNLRMKLTNNIVFYQGYPSLAYYRLIKTVESFFRVDLSDVREDSYIDYFKTKMQIIKSLSD